MAHKRKKRNAFRTEKGPLGSPKHTLEDNTKMDLKQAGMAWTGLIWLSTETTGRLW
jgi:hypothetical protein